VKSLTEAEYFGAIDADLGEWSPRVGYSLNDVVEDGRIVFNVAYVDANGIKVLAAESYVVSQGKIVDQLNIEARKEA
jgi:hypothetical protein